MFLPIIASAFAEEQEDDLQKLIDLVKLIASNMADWENVSIRLILFEIIFLINKLFLVLFQLGAIPEEILAISDKLEALKGKSGDELTQQFDQLCGQLRETLVFPYTDLYKADIDHFCPVVIESPIH